MGTSSSSIFSGNSRYASDFQAVIDRTVAIASLPLSLLEKNRSALTDRSTALAAVDARFSALQTAVQSVSTALAKASFSAAVSDSTAVSATVGEGATEGTYTVKVLGLGSYSSSLSPTPDGTAVMRVPDPGAATLSSAASFDLTVGGITHTVVPASGTLNALAAAINAEADAGVHATVLNVGSSGAPDYRLWVQNNKLGPAAISLQAGTAVLLEEQSRGTLATYNVNGAKVDGVDLVATSDSRTVQISPGLSVSLIKSGGAPVDITVSRSSSSVADALSAVATAYNAAADELRKHRGRAGGALSGDLVVTNLSKVLQELTSYTTEGSITSLQSLGLSFDQNGRLSFDSAEFMAADTSAVGAFLGAAETGGFLKAAFGVLAAIEQPDTGELKGEMTGVTEQISKAESQIAEQQLRIDQLKTSLMAQMAAADAAIAALEQQYKYISSMFDAMQANSQK